MGLFSDYYSHFTDEVSEAQEKFVSRLTAGTLGEVTGIQSAPPWAPPTDGSHTGHPAQGPGLPGQQPLEQAQLCQATVPGPQRHATTQSHCTPGGPGSCVFQWGHHAAGLSGVSLVVTRFRVAERQREGRSGAAPRCFAAPCPPLQAPRPEGDHHCHIG